MSNRVPNRKIAFSMNNLDAERSIIYDDENIRLIWQPGHSDNILITFGDAVNLVDGSRFFADRYAGVFNIPCLGFMAKRPNWYPAYSVESASKVAFEIYRKYKKRIIYGGSMGGYAAIKYSKILEADLTISFCPQYSIDPSDCVVSPYDVIYFNDTLSGMSIKKEDISGVIFIFFDPSCEIDRIHHDHIKDQTLITEDVYVHCANHHVTSMLAGSNNLHRIIEMCLDYNLNGLRGLVVSIKRDSPIRGDVITYRLLMKNRRRAILFITKHMRSNPILLFIFLKYINIIIQEIRYDISLLMSLFFSVIICLVNPSNWSRIWKELHRRRRARNIRHFR